MKNPGSSCCRAAAVAAAFPLKAARRLRLLLVVLCDFGAAMRNLGVLVDEYRSNQAVATV
jgi:hypothetical protein